jgi:threonine/homoserine/homoserine lactone efflux protein
VIPTDHILPFLLTALVIIVVPGPNVVFVVGRALAYGRRTAVTTAAGGTFGAYMQAILVSVGLGTLVERSTLVYSGLKLIGAAYLVFLGIKAFRHRHALRQGVQAADAEAGEAGTSTAVRVGPTGLRAARQGVLVGLTNPKAAVFFGAILPQFVNRSSGHVPEQMILLATLFSVMALICDSTWGVAAGTARDWFARSPRRLALVGGAGGLAMVGVGVGIAVTGRTD